MAYHLARLVQLEFGFESVAVGSRDATHGIFHYDNVFPLIPIDELINNSKDRDLLIVNPSFSPHWLGLRCKGRKLMYVQGFSTFQLLDCHFDRYVTVSTFVQNFVRSTYGIRSRVIPPFIRASRFPKPRPWRERRVNSILVSKKGDQNLQTLLQDRLRLALSTRQCDVQLDDTCRQGRPQHELLEQLGEYRHFLTLSPAEGFGLMPLEAMAMGTTLLGFDGYGGRDYMRPGINCDVTSFGDIEGVADGIVRAIAQPDYAEALALAGRETAHQPCYTYESFYSSWRAEFEDLLTQRDY
jgi:glycosyltransferase involved in cell wall biosynthesis